MRYIIFCFYLIVLISCDRELTFDFYVTNQYSEEIKIKFENYNNEKTNLSIESNEKNKVYTQIEYGSKIGNGNINLESLFKYFIIESDTVESKLDYRTNNLWEYNKLSETHAEYRLTIDSTDFK